MDPKDWLRFVQLDPFVPAWKALGLDDGDLRALEIAIMVDPIRAPVVSGTGGLRKVRFAPDAWGTGASGGARVYYAYFPEHGIVTLIFAHRKADAETIPKAMRNEIKRMIDECQQYLLGNR